MKPFSFYAMLAFLLVVTPSTGCGGDERHSDYVGQETREIKSLSPQDIREYQEGEGMGLAKVAELNGYPGPRHVLDLSEELSLTSDQLSGVRGIYERMHTRAVELGENIVEKERTLDQIFASGQATAEGIVEMTRDIGTIQSSLREAHLLAHLETLQILKDDQVRRYYSLRGYSHALQQEGSHHH